MSSKLSAEQINHSLNLIQNAHHIVVTSHKTPDGDAIGSALAMHHFLIALGKNVTTILPDEVPEFLQWLPAYNDILIFDKQPDIASAAIEKADLIFALDYNVLSRTGASMQAKLESAKADFILIDHHQQPGDFPKVVYSDTKACSTCEMLFRFIEQCGLKEKINIAMAECIYCGIMTDSGSFRFPSVSADTHRIVGDLISLGMDHANIHRQVYDTNLLDRLRLVGYALSEKLEIIEYCATALISLTAEELKRFNHRQGDTESLVNQALSIKGIKLAAFFREGNNEVKISLRSKGSFDVNAFARKHWQGGGHINAAGGSSQQDMAASLQKFKKLALEYKNEITIS